MNGEYIELLHEIELLINSIPENNKELKLIVELMLNNGHRLKEAKEQINKELNIRTLQRQIKKHSKGKVNFRKIRKLYLFMNPENLFKPPKTNEERNKLTLKLRWEVLLNYNFKCNICGRSGKETVLQVDHIIPISKGGKTEMENLQVLCKDCNYGKGARGEK